MKILVTGANGMLGIGLCPILASEGHLILRTDIQDAENSDLRYLDITDSLAVESVIGEFKPDMVIHLAAETEVDKCELNPERAYKTNVLGTKNIAQACKDYEVIMVYMSTCCVFDGEKQSFYTELDEPNPLNVYAKTKLEGEKIVKNLPSRYFIFRVGWMMGGNEKDKKFVAAIVKKLKAEKEILVVDDKFGTPTYTIDLSNAMVKVIKTNRFGLYHITNTGYCSRYQLACKIREYLKKENVVIKPVSSSEMSLPARRPRSEAAESVNLKLIGLGGIMRPWQEALRDYLAELENHLKLK